MSGEPEIPAEAGSGPQKGWPPWVKQWVLPYVQETGLLPVLMAILGHVVVILAPLMLAIARGATAAALPLTVLVMGSFWLCKTDFEENGRPAGVTFTVVSVWIASAALAYVAGTTGVF